MKTLKKKYITKNESNRLYGYEKPIVALTGGIATGKSTVTKMLEKKGFKIIDADQLVKSIYETKEAKDFIKAKYPDAWKNETIHFPKLRELFFHSSDVKKDVENFIYQRLPDAFKKAADKIHDQNFFIYDVPLLFEKGLDVKVDVSVTVYAPRNIQRARLMERDGHVEEMANQILSHQMEIEDKKLKSDFVIENGASMVELAASLDQFLQQVLE